MQSNGWVFSTVPTPSPPIGGTSATRDHRQDRANAYQWVSGQCYHAMPSVKNLGWPYNFRPPNVRRDHHIVTVRATKNLIYITYMMNINHAFKLWATKLWNFILGWYSQTFLFLELSYRPWLLPKHGRLPAQLRLLWNWDTDESWLWNLYVSITLHWFDFYWKIKEKARLCTCISGW